MVGKPENEVNPAGSNISAEFELCRRANLLACSVGPTKKPRNRGQILGAISGNELLHAGEDGPVELENHPHARRNSSNQNASPVVRISFALDEAGFFEPVQSYGYAAGCQARQPRKLSRFCLAAKI